MKNKTKRLIKRLEKVSIKSEQEIIILQQFMTDSYIAQTKFFVQKLWRENVHNIIDSIG